MPSVNPIWAQGESGEYLDFPVFQVEQATPRTQSTLEDVIVNGTYGSTNAAGTQQNTAAHVAVIVLLAGLGILALRLTDFRFGVAGNIGIGG